MIIKARYAHTNLIAQDWRALARFYQEVFGCTLLSPERHFQGEILERGTGVPGARLDGAHLRLPGYGEDGPTLEIFTYSTLKDRESTAANRPGYGHVAFAVNDVNEARAHVVAAGGGIVGEVVTLRISPSTQITWCYVSDPEGNIIELQSYGPE
ncbi:MAG TPA: VOC family protein [Bacteroidota bacterium]|nr:VOC family protein [Bacteroidota bacterium]